MSKVRLIVVQGPNQLLYALSVLRYQEAKKEYQNCEDILILGGYSIDPKLTEVCLQISQIWNFKDRVVLHGFEYLCANNSLDFISASKLLQRVLNLQYVDTIYTLRNWQFINEIFLYAYPEARKICYGELGWLDISSSYWSNLYNSPPQNPSSDFIPVDEAYLVLAPVDGDNTFEKCKVTQVESDFFTSVIYDSAKQIPGLREYCLETIKKMGDEAVIILTSYDTEAGYIKNSEEEINCYLSCVLPYIRENEFLLIKGHPRQKYNQSQRLAEKLIHQKHNAYVVSELTQVPIELFTPFIKFKKVIAPISSASVSLAHLCSAEFIVGYGEKLIKKYIHPKYQEAILIGEYIRILQTQYSIDNKNEVIDYFKLKINLQQYNQEPVRLLSQQGNISYKETKEESKYSKVTYRLRTLLEKFSQEDLQEEALEKLRHLRKEMADMLINSDEDSFDKDYANTFIEAYRLLLTSTIKYEQLTGNEQQFVTQILTNFVKGFKEPKAIQYLLVAMLYCHPHQLPLIHNLTDIPNWLVMDYLRFRLQALMYFQNVGEANSYYKYMEEWVDYLHRNVINSPDSSIWQNAADLFAITANFIPLYFNEANLTKIYTQRAEIIEFALNRANHNIDYEFAEIYLEKKKIRVGILANHYSPQTETFATLSIYKHLNRDIFEIILFTSQTSNHRLERYCFGHTDAFIQLPVDLAGQVKAIREAELDILFISTNVTAVTHHITLLALHRLARVQIVDANSPVTTGMRNIDYYISSKLSEKGDDAQLDYTEKLIKLDCPPQCFDFATEEQILPTITVSREDIGIEKDTVVYISGANYYKIIPELEETWAKIIASIPNSVLLLYPFNPNWASSYPCLAFRNRIINTFSKYGLNENRLIILDPAPNRADVKERLKLGDVYLDSFPYSGMTSLIDPLEVGLPTVVMEAESSRSRKGASLLRELELPNYIANNETDYIKLAITLGTQPELRKQISDYIKQKIQAKPAFLNSSYFSDQIGTLFQELFQRHQDNVFVDKLRLKDINLIIFPDWSQSENILYQEIYKVISTLANHPHKNKITLIIEIGELTEEDANLFISDIVMNLLLEEELDVADGLEISLVGHLTKTQWEALETKIGAKVTLEHENKKVVTQLQAEKLASYNVL